MQRRSFLQYGVWFALSKEKAAAAATVVLMPAARNATATTASQNYQISNFKRYLTITLVTVLSAHNVQWKEIEVFRYGVSIFS